MNQFQFSEIEKNYIRNYLHANRRLIILGSILLFIFMSDLFFPANLLGLVVQTGFRSTQYNDGAYLYGENLYYVLSFLVVALAFFLAVYQYRFLNKRSSCDLYLSLPIKRERLFFLHYFIGVMLLVTMTFGVFILSCTIGSPNGFGLEEIGVALIIEILGVACFSLLSWINIKCNSMPDAIIISILYLLLPLILHLSIRSFFSNVESSVIIADMFASNFNTDVASLITNFLSPIWLMRTIIYIVTSPFVSGVYYISIPAIFFWIVMIFFLFLQGKHAFLQKHGEESGQRTNAFMTYPFLIPFFIFTLMLFFVGNEFDWLLIIIVFILYLLLMFFAQRKIKFHRSMCIHYLIIVIITQAGFALMVHTSVFGMINEIPKDVENKYIELRVYRDEVDKKEFGYDIQRVDEYDSQILAYRDEYQSFQEKAIELRLSSTILQTYPSEDYHIAIRICDDYMCNSASYDHMYMISKDKKEEVEDFIRTWTEKGILESQSDPQVQGEEE